MKEFRKRFGAVVANGQGEMKGQLFRIAHLGYYDYLDTIAAIGALEQVLAEMGRPSGIRRGLRAAQQVYAESSAAGGGGAVRTESREAGCAR